MSFLYLVIIESYKTFFNSSFSYHYSGLSTRIRQLTIMYHVYSVYYISFYSDKFFYYTITQKMYFFLSFNRIDSMS